MLTLLWYVPSLKWVAPTVLMVGSAPPFFLGHVLWRAATALLPSKVYQVGDDLMYSAYQRMVLFFFEHVTGVDIIMYGDQKEVQTEKENVIFICNHTSTVDWIIANILAVRQGSIGHIRYVLKEGIKYLPLYGHYFRQHSGIYVKRSGKYQKNKSREQLAEMATSRTPYWLVIFPEGTRFNDVTLEQSQTFCKNHELPCFSNVLMPRSKALLSSVHELRSTCNAIYDVTIAYSGTQSPVTNKRLDPPELTEFLNGHSKQIHLHVNRIEMKDIPNEEDELNTWLMQQFVKKDKILEGFYFGNSEEKGRLGDSGRRSALSLAATVPAVLVFTAVNAAMMSTPLGRSIYWKTCLFGTLFGYAWVTFIK